LNQRRDDTSAKNGVELDTPISGTHEASWGSLADSWIWKSLQQGRL